ncbi:MAG: L-histidine N(alpha)-methyltransferase, partial [Ktedonobacteraceae bacterium]|nr:L-histidine N(alpha)-methyltransferase [Ktedonobacteraceae bacterium]
MPAGNSWAFGSQRRCDIHYQTPDPPKLYDFAPRRTTFYDEVLQGLQNVKKALPSKYFYDDAGSQLFERICQLDEYYLTRIELSIMQQYRTEIASLIGPDCLLIEYGSG